MISNDIQELLKKYYKVSNLKSKQKKLDVLISRQLTHIDNIDFHRYEISHKEIGVSNFLSVHFVVLS